MVCPSLILAQRPTGTRLNIIEALSAAKGNLQYDVNRQQISRGQAQVNSSGALPKTGLFAENEDLRPSDNKGILKIGLSQSIAWPGLYKAQKNLYSEQVKYYESNMPVIDADLKRYVRAVYYQLWYLQDKQKLFSRLDSIYSSLNNAAILKVRTGDSPGLDSIAANVRSKELQALLQQINNDIRIQQQLMMQLLNSEESSLPVDKPLEKLAFPAISLDSSHPVINLQQQNVNIAKAEVSVAKNENRPEFSGRFFSQRLYGMKDPFSGFSVGATFPLFGSGAYRSKVKVAQAEANLAEKQLQLNRQLFTSEKLQAEKEVEKNNGLLAFYETSGIRQSTEIIKASSLAYRAGEISFAELSQFLSQAIEIQRNYLETLNAYNQSVIHYNYFVNQ